MARLRTNLAFGAGALAAVLISAAILLSYISSTPSASVLRLGYFPNVTHAQALYGISTGVYQQYLGSDITLQTRAFNAGPTAIQALLSNQVDLVFVGPAPTLSGLAAAGPDVLRVIAGGASGGALFVIQPNLNLTTSADFSGKRFATPQAGNTQDIALKHYLLTQGHHTLEQGGDVDVINAANADILALFQLGQIDGAWVPEPWATRLVLEPPHGKVFLDQRSLWPGGQFVSTHLLTTKRYIEAHRDVVRRFLNATVSLTLYLQTQPLQDPNSTAVGIINGAIANLTGSRLNATTINTAFSHLNISYDPIRTSLAAYLTWAQQLGFFPSGVDPSALYDLSLLNDILLSRGLPLVS